MHLNPISAEKYFLADGAFKSKGILTCNTTWVSNPSQLWCKLSGQEEMKQQWDKIRCSMKLTGEATCMITVHAIDRWGYMYDYSTWNWQVMLHVWLQYMKLTGEATCMIIVHAIDRWGYLYDHSTWNWQVRLHVWSQHMKLTGEATCMITAYEIDRRGYLYDHSTWNWQVRLHIWSQHMKLTNSKPICMSNQIN